MQQVCVSAEANDRLLMIQLTNVVKNYGLNAVLRGISFHIQAGEFVTLVGPNGAGKSTLLRIVASLMPATSGEVLVGGWPLPAEAARVRRHLGLVSHQSLLYRDLTAAENLTFFAKLYDLDDVDERVAQALRKVGLWARQRDPVSSFSRGMVQRLTIARATLHEPDVLLFDEPYTGLDQDAAQLLDELLAQEKASGRTILLITHDLLRGVQQCDRVLVLNRGKVAADLPSAEITPAEFVAHYRTLTQRKPKRSRTP